MNDKRGKNTAASVRDRLLVLARDRGEDFQLLLTRYGLERLLYRLGKSGYRDRFILKGAMLFMLWSNQPHRPTRDADFLGFGDSSEAGLKAIFRELCDISVEDDGLNLMADSVQVEAIRNTFSRRRTPLPEHTPSGLSSGFYEDAQKNTQWNAFLRKGMLATSPPSLTDVCRFLEMFLLPPTQALAGHQDFRKKWSPGGPWH